VLVNFLKVAHVQLDGKNVPMCAVNALQHRLEVDCQLCTAVALPQMKDLLELIECDAGLAPEAVWML
jgi:hypothetical protein